MRAKYETGPGKTAEVCTMILAAVFWVHAKRNYTKLFVTCIVKANTGKSDSRWQHMNC